MQGLRLYRHSMRLRQAAQRRFATNEVHPRITMNDLPHPQGCWQTHYDRNQRKYNRDLIIGIVTLTATLGFGHSRGYHQTWASSPANPATIQSYKQ